MAIKLGPPSGDVDHDSMAQKLLNFGLTKRRFHGRLGLLFGCFLLVAGCSTTPSSIPVADRGRPPKVTSGTHRVQPGDTLYSIAWRYGWDFKELASANGLKSPYIIYPGQNIRFSTYKKTQKPKQVYVKKASAAPQKAVQKNSTKEVKKPPKKPVSVVAVTHKGWRWPTEGPILSRFSSSSALSKGIDIAGKLGQPVRAAGAGTVVYAGSGLLGYGQLVIIKHNDTYLSAYAHNRRLQVKEGQKVSAGQQIAELGASGTDRAKLHFEIRRQGKPVDPLKYLPKR